MIRRFSPLVFLIGIGIGLAIGLVYAWLINPVVLTGISPAQLSLANRQNYAITISLAYAQDHDLMRAASRMGDLGIDFQFLADTACNLARTNYASTTTGLIAIRSMTNLAASQNKWGCASTLIAVPTITPIASTPTPGTPIPSETEVASKTPSVTIGPTYTPATPILPTVVQTSAYTLIRVTSFCDPKTPGVIQVNVYDVDGKTGLPGVQIQVTSGDTQDTFFTGLEPERGDGFADVRMTPGGDYTINIDGADKKPDVQASDCGSKNGKSVTSYQADYRREAKP
jgi:hypothetical protein